jgi:hypothetical protein
MVRKGLWWVAAFEIGLLGVGCQNNAALCPSGLSPCGQLSCVDTTTNALDCGGCGLACAANELCQDSLCVCQPGATSCSGYCVLTDSDPKHCGACGHACDDADVCQQGTCQPAHAQRHSQAPVLATVPQRTEKPRLAGQRA